MATLVPVQIDENTVLYIEAEDSGTAIVPPVPAPLSGLEEQRRGGEKGLGMPPVSRPAALQSMQLVQTTIRTYTLCCLSAFKNLAPATVDEVTLEFGINLSADAGIPYIASGKAQSNLKITVKCSYNHKAETPE